MSFFDLFRRSKPTQKSTTVVSGPYDTSGWPIDTGTSEVGFHSHYAVQRAIELRAHLLATIPVKIFKGDRELEPGENITYGTYRFNFRMPFPSMSLSELFRIITTYYIYNGEFFLAVDDSYPFNIKPLNPKFMSCYNGVWKHKNVPMDSNSLILLQKFSPDTFGGDTDRGQGILDTFKTEIQNDMDAMKYIESSFKNRTGISGILEAGIEAGVDDDEMQKLVNQFNAKYGGVPNAKKVAGLPADISFNTIDQDAIDASLLPLRKETTERILAALGVNQQVLGLDKTANRSVTEEATRILYTHSVIPDAKLFRDHLNAFLFNQFFPGYRFDFDFSDIQELQRNKESLLAQAKQLRELGYALNEVNKHLALGMPEIDDPIGNMRFIPSQLIPYDEMAMDDGEDDDEMPSSDDSDKKKDDDSDKGVTDKVPGNTEEKATKQNRLIDEFEKLQRTQARKMKGKISKHFSTQLKAVMKLFYKHTGTKDVIEPDYDALRKDILEFLSDDKEALSARMEPLYAAASLDADKLALRLLDKESLEAVAHPDVVRRLSKKIADINNTTYRYIKRTITSGIEAQFTVNEMAKSLRKVFKYNSARRTVIAMNESASIISQSTDKRYRKEGVEKKAWLSSGGADVRDSHAMNASFGVVDYDFVYPNGQKFPHDGRAGADQNINCHCALQPVIE